MKIISRTIQNRYCFFDRLQLRSFIDFGTCLGGLGGNSGRKTEQPIQDSSHTHLHTPKSLLRSASATLSRSIFKRFTSFQSSFFNEFLMFGRCFFYGCCVVPPPREYGQSAAHTSAFLVCLLVELTCSAWR